MTARRLRVNDGGCRPHVQPESRAAWNLQVPHLDSPCPAMSPLQRGLMCLLEESNLDPHYPTGDLEEG